MTTEYQKSLIRRFVADMRDIAPCPYIQTRDVRTSNELRTAQLRSKKHSLLAICWDELGNAFVLTAQGQRKQLIGSEIPA